MSGEQRSHPGTTIWFICVWTRGAQITPVPPEYDDGHSSMYVLEYTKYKIGCSRPANGVSKVVINRGKREGVPEGVGPVSYCGIRIT